MCMKLMIEIFPSTPSTFTASHDGSRLAKYVRWITEIGNFRNMGIKRNSTPKEAGAVLVGGFGTRRKRMSAFAWRLVFFFHKRI